MQTIYKIVASNPEYFIWAFGVVNVLWVIFVYFNKQSHDKAMERLKHNYKVKEIEVLPLIQKLQELEALAGEAIEIAISYRPVEEKRCHRSRIYVELDRYAGQLSKYQPLKQAIKDLNQYCAIMAEENPHESCRQDILAFYQVLIDESEKVKRDIMA